MELWVSRYALTEGIKSGKWDGTISSRGYVSVTGYWMPFKLGRDAHKSKEEALTQAEKMRVKKIASLRKSLTKLEELVF